MIRLENLNDANGLAVMFYLNNDAKLLEKLKSARIGDMTLEEFLDYNSKWCIKRSAILFSIIYDNKAIGSISLSDIDRKNGHTSVGYWIASEYWGKGYGKEAFKEIIKIAKELGLKILSSKILKDNIASRKIWDKYGAKFSTIDEKAMYTLDIENLEI